MNIGGGGAGVMLSPNLSSNIQIGKYMLVGVAIRAK